MEIKNALIVTPFYKPNIGGAETFAEDLAKTLSKKYVVHISTIKWKKPIIWQGMNIWKAFWLALKLFFPTRKLIKKYEYEKIYALGIIPSFICGLLKIKFNSVILALYDFKKANFMGKIINKADKVFVEGEQGKRDMLTAGVEINKIIKFQHWVDQTRFYYIPRIKDKLLRVLFVGRAIPIKGKHIIEQCEKLTQGIIYEYIENVPYADLPKYYQDADICIVPSLYSEGFSRVVVEAANCGCYLLTSNNGSLPDMVRPFGLSCEPTYKNFADILNKINRNRKFLSWKQYKTAEYARQAFGEHNANCFIMQ